MKNELFTLIEILLVENNPDDVILIQNTLFENRFFNKINVVNKLEDAVNVMNKAEPFTNIPYPDIILLSLSSLLSQMEMNEIEEIKNINFDDIDVYILTNDEVEEDLLIEHGIKYPNLKRPLDFFDFIDTIVCRDNFQHAIIKPIS